MNAQLKQLLIITFLTIQPIFIQAFSISEQDVGLGIAPFFIGAIFLAIHLPYLLISFFYAVNSHRYGDKKAAEFNTGLKILALINALVFIYPIYQNSHALAAFFFFLIPSLFFALGTFRSRKPLLNFLLTFFYILHLMLIGMGGYENPKGYGPKSGEHKTYYGSTTSQIRTIEHYAYGYRHGTYQEFQPSGHPSILVQYNYDTITHVQEFHDSGELKNEYDYDHQLVGPYVSYYKNGQIEVQSFFKNGLLHGEEKVYYENGTLASHFHYDQGVLTGTCNDFYPNQSPKSTCIYEAGKGEYKSYYPSGQLMEIGWRNGNTKEGLWKSYFENGQLGSEGYYLANDYNDALKHGLWKTYHENGQVETMGEYKKGIRIGKWVKYHDTGEKSDSKDYGKAK